MCKIIALLLVALSVGSSQSGDQSPPPVAPVWPFAEDHVGAKVVDTYCYIKNLRGPEVQAWMRAQKDYARAVLAEIPGHANMPESLRDLDKICVA